LATCAIAIARSGLASETSARLAITYLASRETGARLAFRGRLEVIPLGVDTERFTPGDPAEARVRLGLPRSARLLLWLGRFSAHDKADLLPTLRLFRDFRAPTPSARCA
jgi:D-inositol-3-phosphate glycosyltransferase